MTTRKQRIVVERHQKNNERPEWWTMFDSGEIEVFDTAGAALAAIRKRARRGNKGVTLTQIEWRGVPDGWQPPQAYKNELVLASVEGED